MNKKNTAFCLYSKEKADDSGIESLKIFLPTGQGYINHNIVHSVSDKSKCDIWRLSVVYFCDSELNRIKPLTRSGAEWEMALKLSGRPDFIGGYAHGDEVFQSIKVKVDGREVTLESLEAQTQFDSLSFEVFSTGYDPCDSITEVLLHYKKITVEGLAVRVEQRVEWLGSYELGRSYMAMMPPLKTVTDCYCTDIDPIKKPINLAENISGCGADAVCLCGEDGFGFEMKVEKYLTDGERGNSFLITDNGGVPYNKMYFILHHSGAVNKGDVWDTETIYTVDCTASSCKNIT